MDKGRSPMTDRFAAQLGARATGARPDGEHLGRIVEVKEAGDGWNVFVEIDGTRHRHYTRSAAFCDQLGTLVTLKVWHDGTGAPRSSLRPGGTNVFKTDEARLTVDGEVVESPKGLAQTEPLARFLARDWQKSVPTEPDILDQDPTVVKDMAAASLNSDPQALAWEAHTQLMRGKQVVRFALIDIAEACWQIREQKLWRQIGTDYEKIEDYLASPEVNLTKTVFYDAADIWKTVVLEHGVDATRLGAIDRSKLSIVLPKLKAGEVTVEKALTDAEVLGARDLRAVYRDQVPPAETQKCPTCGKQGYTP